MERLYQRFDLNEKSAEQAAKSRNAIGRLARFPSLLAELKKIGYEVLVDEGRTFGGLPDSVIIGGKPDIRNRKEDFFRLCEKYDLPFYASGSFYMKQAR